MSYRYLLNAFIGLLMLFPFQVSAQQKIEINGIILDESNNPIPFVAIGIVEKYIGTASTEDGEFSLLVTKAELQDSLSISSLGYDPFKIKVADYLKLTKREVVLKESVTELDEIKILKPSEYVALASKNMKANTISTPHQIEMLYRRAVTEGGQPKFLVENYIKVRDRGPAYYFGLMQVAESRKSADYRIWKPDQRWHSINGMASLHPFRPNDSQHKRNLKKFIWKKIGDSSYEGEDVLILEGTNSKMTWEKIKVFIGMNSYKVYRIERGNTLYIYKKHKSGKLVLSYYRHSWKIPKERFPLHLRNSPASDSDYKAEAFVYKVITDKKQIKVVPYGIDVDMGMIDLPYNATFWNNLSVPPDTKFYKKIKDGLEGVYGVSLEDQYKYVNEK
ncbi:carboxypeptidase-like regulatory domain-containing protein [Seonamhaeicola sp.]|uniref:carboxypeptidase-like regulatory domain-containing protein n=1 Tax=Seonamhaeicola sp. TaxID=1912245 RepID=UPI00262E38AA|nr:carboxypeptidase-like regulatory domain-containing protein [Seonamhaeicola sp.]